HRSALPRLIGGASPCVPAGRQISKLQNRRVNLHGLLKGNKCRVFRARVADAKKLPTVVVRIMCNVKDGFLAIDNLPQREHRTIARLIEWPWLNAHHLTRTRSATAFSAAE